MLCEIAHRENVITATTGKAAYSIRGVTVHSLLKLPTGPQSEKDLSSQSPVELQEKLSNIDYILIEEYSMLGQRTFGWLTNDADNCLVQKKICSVESQ